MINLIDDNKLKAGQIIDFGNEYLKLKRLELKKQSVKSVAAFFLLISNSLPAII